MLPFLKQKRTSGLIISQRKPDGDKEELHSEGNEDHAMEAVAEDMLRAFANKDVQHLASALRSAFQILDAEPHNEGPHLNELEENE